MSERENKEIARRYHNLKPEDVDTILAPNFIGRGRTKPDGGYLGEWDREAHRKYLTGILGTPPDTIHEQIAEGDWVATRFTRELKSKGKKSRLDAMHFKRFVNGKIAEIWVYADPQQLQEEVK